MDLQTILFWTSLGTGSILLFGMLIALLMTLLGIVMSLVFFKTRKLLIPNITLPILHLLESPIRWILWKVGIEEDIVSNMMIDLINMRYRDQYVKTPYDDRMVFLPQCLRHPKCPAPMSEEGIMCISCGRCGIGAIKEEANQLGTRLFIAPGSSLIKRMIKRYKPKAILGIGCSMEVKEGTELISAIGMPVQGIKLLNDGCVNTRLDIVSLMEMIKADPKTKDIMLSKKDLERAKEIAAIWDENPISVPKIKKKH